ncbi:TonB-dependent receptor [Sphingobacterium sp. BIGb0165]|uniref:TonB-dependent receptor n=1 Tax=Sphingobacterium sp. BIGb0165 TaxID=2940615 RepID=UPI0021678CAB|nr:TonB-dependent receptor [Sphingobacterium sp. BIGb0165]MCS4224590.1 outer membrane receptor protein involved in Fe transport [Sphingobacterium sp. BIGb0165]
MQINKFLLTGLLFSVNSLSIAQISQTLIRGKVSGRDGQPVQGASVLVKSTKFGTVSADNGSFELKLSSFKSYVLQISAVGYLSQEKEVLLKPTDTSSVDIMLERNSRSLGTVDVNGITEKTKLIHSGFNVNAIETKSLANSATDLNQILSRSTGVRVRESGGLGSDFNFSINGLSGKQVKFFIDGIPMENFGNSMSLNNIPVNLAERIEVYKGVVPVELGADALGGAVNIVTNQNVDKYFDASYGYGSFNTHRAALSGRYTDVKTGFTINASGFYNYSDNNYLMRDMTVRLASGGNEIKDVKRFHDAFRSTMGQVEMGFRNKEWADIFLLGALYSSGYKERQTGAQQDIVFGQVHSRGNFFMPSLKYKKKNLFLQGLDVSVFASYAKDRTTSVDTSAAKYNWEGNIISTDKNFAEQGAFSLFKYTNKFFVVRTNVAYALNTGNSIDLNYSLTAGRRTGINTYQGAGQDNNPLDIPNKLDKGVLGLSWQNRLFDERLTTSVFAKQYHIHSYIRSAVYYNGSGYVKEEADQSTDYYGYGIATRFKLADGAGIKASFEHAYRLPDVEELFGDGVTVLANPQLKPEESDNFNLGIYYGRKIGEHHFSAEASGFYRGAKDFINAVPGGIYSSFINIGKVNITGFDGELKYGYKDWLNFTVNGSYMNALNADKSSTVFEDRIPNQPWLFGNADLSLGKNELFGKDTRLQFNWFTQYTHWFYLNWPSRGFTEGKSRIPTQTIHNATLTYSFQQGRYNLSLESRNIFNETAYDSFRLQKPGRSFLVKLRYFIK